MTVHIIGVLKNDYISHTFDGDVSLNKNAMITLFSGTFTVVQGYKVVNLTTGNFYDFSCQTDVGSIDRLH